MRAKLWLGMMHQFVFLATLRHLRSGLSKSAVSALPLKISRQFLRASLPLVSQYQAHLSACQRMQLWKPRRQVVRLYSKSKRRKVRHLLNIRARWYEVPTCLPKTRDSSDWTAEHWIPTKWSYPPSQLTCGWLTPLSVIHAYRPKAEWKRHLQCRHCCRTAWTAKAWLANAVVYPSHAGNLDLLLGDRWSPARSWTN